MESNDEIRRNIVARQRKAIQDAAQGIYYDRPAGTSSRPAPRSEDDDAEDEGQMARQRRLAAERRAAAETKIPVLSRGGSTTTPSPPHERADGTLRAKLKRPRRFGSSPIGRKAAEHEGRWRICDAKWCGFETGSTMRSLCPRHLKNRTLYGHPKAARYRLRKRDYGPLLRAARHYLRHHPPPSSILESVQSFLIPPGKLTGRDKGRKTRNLLISEMLRWRDPRYRKTYFKVGYYEGKTDYSPRGYLATMLAVEMYVADREGQGFPGDAEAIEKGAALAKMHKRPARSGEHSQPMSGSLMRAIHANLLGFQTLRVYVALTARTILALPAPRPLRRTRIIPATVKQHSLRVEQTTATPPPPPRPTREVRHDLPPRRKKPNIGRLCTAAELREWQRVEALWRLHPHGYYSIKTEEEVTT